MDQREGIGNIIQEYDSQGWHRTGTEADRVSARWLCQQVLKRGLEPALESVTLSRIVPGPCYVDVGDYRVNGLPLFDGGFTAPGGVRGRIGPLGSDSEVGLLEVGPGGVVEDLRAARISTRHLALVAVTLGGAPGLAVRNADSFLAPFGPPVLQVSSEAASLLVEHAQQGSTAHLEASVTRVEAESFNVFAHLRGGPDDNGEDLSPLVVMTPRSGWWHCAAERGGGLACWLETMQLLADSKPRRDVLFVATTGHELGLLGIEAFMERHPGIVPEALAWLHFGASIGAKHDHSPRLSASDTQLHQLAQDALERVGVGQVPAAPTGTVAGAEAKVVHDRGARCLAIAGGHAFFHINSDRWPEAVDVDAVAGYATAFADVAFTLADSPIEEKLPGAPAAA